MTRLALPALFVGASLFAAPAPARADWTRLASEHFVFVGDAPERTIRNVARRLEQFRDVVSRVVSDRATASPVPTVVMVFSNDRSFAPFKPLFRGKPIELAGVFSSGGDVNYIALNAEQDTQAYGVIFHEYAHALVGNTVGNVPPWVNEGLAEFYQTFESSADGKSARIGRPSEANLYLLQSMSGMMPLAQLVAVQHDSPLYNEGDRRTLFYAESWALVHYLSFGSPERAGQLQKYLTAASQGAADMDTFRGAFGQDVAALEREIRNYVRGFTFNTLLVNFSAKIAAGTTSPAAKISDQEAAGYRGDLLAHVNRIDDAREYLRRVVDGGGAVARPLTALGQLEMRAGNDEAAFPLLERAASMAPGDDVALTAYGLALMTRAVRGTAAGNDDVTRARTVLSRALELAPGNVTTMVALARLEMQSRGDVGQAVTLLRRSVETAPGREQYRLMLAEALAMQGDYRAATAQLGTLMARGSRPQIRDAARQALARVAEATNAERNRSSRSPADAPAVGAADATDAPPAPASATSEPRRPSLPQGMFMPSLRRVNAGEVRELGTFIAVECRSNAIILHVDAAAGQLRMAVPGFKDVEFVSYRQETPGSIPCGPQQPAYRVLATYRTDAPIEGTDTVNRAVAIELLPDGYTPR